MKRDRGPSIIDGMSARADTDVLFAELLKPSPPLPPNALRAILAVVAAINLVFMVSFILRGAWPIAPFMGGDVLLLAWAFRQSQLAAEREEHVTLTRAALLIRRRPAASGAPEIVLNPYWVRVEMDDPPRPESHLTLWTHGKGVRIGGFLGPAERAGLAKRLKAALWRAKNRLP